ncbi:MAG: hypothetical protein HKN79_06415 [Flavobacteriales bacterium]|nr:hypothetical protein [Flavobacteriales bacterium]
MKNQENTSKHTVGMKEQSPFKAQEESKASSEPSIESRNRGPYMEIRKKYWAEFKAAIKKRVPQITDEDLPYKEKITDDYFGRIEKKFGPSRRELRDATKAFYTWRA